MLLIGAPIVVAAACSSDGRSPNPGTAGACYDACAGQRAGIGGEAGESSLMAEGGNAGSPSEPAAGTGTAPGASGEGGASGGGASLPPVSEYCGDAIRDPVLEECDDGPGGDVDSCTADCRARTVTVVQPPDMQGELRLRARSLGLGAHPLASSDHGSGIAYLTFEDSSWMLGLARFDEFGGRLGAPVTLGLAAAPTEEANPVAAALPDGDFVVAWNDTGAGSLDVAMQRVSADGNATDVVVANATKPGAQRDPDVIRIGSDLFVAWTNNFDIVLRSFTPALKPTAAEQVLWDGGPSGSVVLAEHAGTWAAAWRALSEGGETLHVMAGSKTSTVGPFPIGAAEERPALVSLDDKHLLVAFTVGTDPLDTGSSSVPRLRLAIADAANPGTLDFLSLPAAVEPYASDESLAQRRPALTRVGERCFLAWQTESPTGTAKQEVFVSEVRWDTTDSLLLGEEQLLTRDIDAAGDQLSPVLAASPLYPEGALVAAWEDSGPFVGPEALPDLVLNVRPTPFLTVPAPGE